MQSTKLTLPEEDADALKHVALLTIYICGAFVGVDNKFYWVGLWSAQTFLKGYLSGYNVLILSGVQLIIFVNSTVNYLVCGKL